jgi:transglutaminase-like putative cysteine protease
VEEQYLAPGTFIDSDSPEVIAFTRDAIGGVARDRDRMLALYRAVRDRIIYDPYIDYADPASYRASSVLKAGRGFCVGKAALLAAGARIIGIPARLGFADVRNHMTSPKLYERIKTDVFMWHAYADLHIDGAWVKATPAFNSALCERVGLAPLEFDGRSDSLFQPFDPSGRRHMEYVQQRGIFADVPFETMAADFRAHYPALMKGSTLSGNFQSEATAGNP